MDARKQLSVDFVGLILLLVVMTSAGCQSSGSKWAWWNPMAKSSEDVTLVASDAPELPSDSATPIVEGTDALGGKAPETAIASTNNSGVNAASEAPAFDPATTNSATTPEAEATQIASTPSLPPAAKTMAPSQTKQVSPAQEQANQIAANITPTQKAAAGGPYDPNAYQPQPSTQVAAAQTAANRYGGEDRYGATSADASYDALPPITPLPSTTGNRYGGDRYASSAPVEPVTPIQPVTPATAPATTPTVTSLPPTTTLPPVQAVASAPKPDTSGLEHNQNPTIGTLPASSVYASTPATPTTPVQQASSNGDTTSPQAVRIATRPGEYRPGGTGTYQTSGSGSTLLK